MLGSLLLGLLACQSAPDPGTDTMPTDPSPTDTGTGTDVETADTATTNDPEPVETADTGTPEPDPGAVIFGGDAPLRIDLTFEPYAYESLVAAPDAWVPATVQFEGFPEQPTAVRLKGNGSFRPITDKASFKLNLDRYEPFNEVDGLDDLVLNNMITDGSGMREILAYEVYRAAGVPAPRARHAEVYVNGVLRGPYALVEDVDGRFLSRWFDDNDGPLYEMFDVELTPAGVWQLDHDGGPDDRSVLMALAEVLEDPGARLTVEGAQYLDIDSFVAYFATSGVIGQFDAYPYSFPGDDVYLYVNPTTSRVHMLPHGGDETFRDADRPIDYVFGALAVACLDDPVCEDMLDDQVWTALGVMEGMDLPARMDTLAQHVPLSDLLETGEHTADQIASERGLVRAFVTERRSAIEDMPGIR